MKNILDMSLTERREFAKILTALNATEQRRYTKEKRDAKEKAKYEAINKREAFINSLQFKPRHKKTDDLALVSILNFANNISREEYRLALIAIETGFKTIQKIKLDHVEFAEQEEEPFSNFFYTTDKRMYKEIEKRKHHKVMMDKQKKRWKENGFEEENKTCVTEETLREDLANLL